MLVSHCATVHKNALEDISYTSIFKTLLALHEGDSNSSGSSSGGDGMPGSSLKTLWGSQSRLFPGMRLPLFPGSVNDDKVDSGVGTFLSNHVTPCLLPGPKQDDVEMTDPTVVEETSPSTAEPAQSEEVSSASSGSPSLLSPLPSVALRSDIVFLKAGEGRDGSERQGTEANSEATRLRSELAIGSNDSGAAETGLVTKRKREDEYDPDLGDADIRAQPRLKLDAVVPEATEQPLAEDQDHGSSVDGSNLDEQGDTADSSGATAPSDLINVSNGDNSALTADNNIKDAQSNNDN